MKVIYAQEPLLESSNSGFSIFLAGPTPRENETKIKSWRPNMIKCLEQIPEKFISEIYVPEMRNGVWKTEYLDQVEWEEEAIEKADILLFWVPRDIKGGMPGLTTNVEFGWWLDKKKWIVLGYPPGADSCRYLEYKFKKFFGKEAQTATTMKELVEQVYNIVKTNEHKINTSEQ